MLSQPEWRNAMIRQRAMRWGVLSLAGPILIVGYAYAQQTQTERGQSSYMPVDIIQPFAQIMARMIAAKPGIERDHMALLTERYDLSDRPAQGVTMDRGKPLQEGVRVKLSDGMTWERLAAMSPDQIRDQNLFPRGFYPLPHPNHIDGGFVFPHFEIDAIKQQDGRDLKRFDIDFDLPDHFLAEFPPAMYLSPRPELGDVSQGKLISLTNYYEMFNGLLTPRQLEGLRLLLTPFPQQQFNATEDRRSELPSIGSACFDCHERPPERRDALGPRYPSAAIPPPHQNNFAARLEHPAAVRIATGAEDS